MPFQGNPNAGAPNVDLLRFLADQKATRAKLAFERQKAEAEARRQAIQDQRDEQKFQMDMLKARAELAGSIQSVFGPQVDAARRTAETTQATNLSREDLLGGGGGMDFASIVGGLDPTASSQVQANDEAQANFLAQAGAASDLMRSINPALSPGDAVNAALGSGRAVESERARAAQIELDKTKEREAREVEREIAKAERDEKRTIRAEQRSVENAVVQSRRIAEGAQMAQLESGDRLINHRHRLRQQIAQAEQEGRDATILNEKLALVNGRISALRDPTSVRQTQGMPPKMRVDTIRQARGSSAGINRVTELSQAMDDGRIKTGAGGAIENFRLRAIGTMESLLNLDPNFDPQVRGALESAISQGQDFVKVRTDEGEQLTLGIDQILLTYEMIRNGRGDNARITVGEISRVAKQFDFTGMFTTEGEIKGALKKTAKALAQERATAFSLFEAFGEDTSLLQGEEIFPEDQALINSISGSSPSPLAPSPSSALDETGTGLEPGVLDSIRQRRGTSVGIQ